MMKKVEGKPDIPTGTVRAFVLCGGARTRLRPLLADQPKSMAPISGAPFRQLLGEKLRCQRGRRRSFGPRDMVEQNTNYLRGRSACGMRRHQRRGDEPRDTRGA